jgi:hypothetical protein
MKLFANIVACAKCHAKLSKEVSNLGPFNQILIKMPYMVHIYVYTICAPSPSHKSIKIYFQFRKMKFTKF